MTNPPIYSDAAKRCSDMINMHVAAGNYCVGSRECWAAIRLNDGGSDGVVYDSRSDAITHQLYEQQCAYVKIPPTGMPPHEAEIFLKMHREIYDAGFRLADPDNRAPQLITPMRREDMADAFRLLRKSR